MKVRNLADQIIAITELRPSNNDVLFVTVRGNYVDPSNCTLADDVQAGDQVVFFDPKYKAFRDGWISIINEFDGSIVVLPYNDWELVRIEWGSWRTIN